MRCAMLPRKCDECLRVEQTFTTFLIVEFRQQLGKHLIVMSTESYFH